MLRLNTVIRHFHNAFFMSQINHLKKEIKKTGYPLEIELSSILDKKWQVQNTASYFDEDEKKMRDLDLVATRYFQEVGEFFLEVNLEIECKKDENFAWVFFTRPFGFGWEEDIDGQVLDELQICSKNLEMTQLWNILLGKSHLHYEEVERAAVSFDSFYLKGKKTTYKTKKNEIFEAENQLKKYIIYKNEQDMSTFYPPLYRLILHFPCIVFDGELFEAIAKDGKLDLKEVDWITLETSSRTIYSTFTRGYLIDIVKKDYFKKFLRKINRGFGSLKKTLKEKRKQMERETDRMYPLLQTPKGSSQ